MITAIDPNSELAIFQFLEDDLQALSFAEDAERIQLQEILTATAPPTQSSRHIAISNQSSDSAIALSIFAAETRFARDQAYAKLLESQDASLAVSRQYAQKLAATEQKTRLDTEFARKLQESIDKGEISPEDRDVDSLLGHDVINDIVASDPNHKGKTRKRDETDNLVLDNSLETNIFESSHVYPVCGICGDPFQETYSPLLASLSANSSARLPFGLRLPCASNHPYCIDCLSKYIMSKLDPDSTGKVPDEQVIFPILCPECNSEQWADGIEDSVAERILAKDNMVLWYHRRLLDSLPRYYCPNQKCSARVQLHEEPEEPQAICPLCQTIMCVHCKTLWHHNFTCDEYQALPPSERSPEDLLLFQLAKDKKWRRCKDCKNFIELTFGCNHITCRCGSHFCFKCGAAWDMKGYKCSRGMGCELWEDDEMLLEEDQRRGGAREGVALDAFAPPVAVPRIEPPPPPCQDRYRRNAGDFEWIYDNAVVSRKHNFTSNMINSTACGYCGRMLVNLMGLRHHLATIQRHPVYSCCGKFFRLREHYEQHRSALYTHEYTCVRNDTGADE